MAHVVFVCTGNAARSVMAGAALTDHLDADAFQITTAGTHVVEGQPMSWRTRDALVHAGITIPAHRSRQLAAGDVRTADVLVGLATDHVRWLRRNHPEAAGRSATLRRLARDLPGDDRPFAERLAALDLAAVELEPWEDVEDPAGGELEDYQRCAVEVRDLIHALAPRLR